MASMTDCTALSVETMFVFRVHVTLKLVALSESLGQNGSVVWIHGTR